MSAPFLDASVVVRLIAGDDPEKLQASRSLLQEVERGERALALTDITVSEIVYVLGSARLYALPREDVALALNTIIRLPGIQMHSKRTMIEALDLYGVSNIDFADCYVVATIRHSDSSSVYSYDRDFDRFDDLERLEP